MGGKVIRSIPPYLPSAAVMVVILYLTLFPKPLGEEGIQLFDGADKVVHFIMFGGLTGTYIFDRWRISHVVTLRVAVVVALCSAVIGACVEYLQYAMRLGRTGNDLYDIMANTLGSFTALFVCLRLHWVNIIIDRRAR